MDNHLPNAALSATLGDGSSSRQGIYCLFARVLDYPDEGFFGKLQELLLQLKGSDSEAAEFLGTLAEESESMTLGEIQELYTGTFDMRPDRTLNLSCHIFGEDVRRNLLMAELKKRMEARRMVVESELPDHLSLVLELEAREESDEEAQTLIADFLVPAVSHLLTTFTGEAETHPYARALQALETFLCRDLETLAAPKLS
jgi:nitrate reductase molybdenum cofactor assembly chaperone